MTYRARTPIVLNAPSIGGCWLFGCSVFLGCCTLAIVLMCGSDLSSGRLPLSYPALFKHHGSLKQLTCTPGGVHATSLRWWSSMALKTSFSLAIHSSGACEHAMAASDSPAHVNPRVRPVLMPISASFTVVLFLQLAAWWRSDCRCHMEMLFICLFSSLVPSECSYAVLWQN